MFNGTGGEARVLPVLRGHTKRSAEYSPSLTSALAKTRLPAYSTACNPWVASSASRASNSWRSSGAFVSEPLELFQEECAAFTSPMARPDCSEIDCMHGLGWTVLK